MESGRASGLKTPAKPENTEELIPDSYFEKYQHNGQHVVNKPTGKDVELCHYRGELRGVPNSWAAISTCSGLSGVIFDGEELHYLERGSDPETGDEDTIDSHFLYRHSDLISNQTCGYSGTPHHILGNQEFNRILRYKREAEAEIIRGPYNANKQSRYVELVLVVDNKEYKEQGESLSAVATHCKKIANIINALYVPLNIFIALVGVVVWSERDEIHISTNGDTTLTNFLQYRRQDLVKEHPNDNAQLLTRMQFQGGVVGKALKGPICTYEFSGGVSMDHSQVVGLVATTVAHEMGHNFGMEHDTPECKCPKERCIMAPSSSSMSPTEWSSCSLEYLALAFEHGMDYCLRNKPTRLFDSPVCGNGFVEAGEQCDCGLKESCDNPCCNATTCMLYANASCATGECCDLQTCRPKTAGSICRSADHECDLPEFCTGQSEYCPNDVYKMDGEKCDRGKAFCYQGSCRTHSDQCRLLWGPSGKSSDMQCYNMNNKGTRHGNCGYNRLNQSFLKCTEEDIYCGMLHCKHLNERLEFGMESVAILSHSFINSGGSIIPCRTAIVDLGLNEVDPGLAPDGAKCGEGKMCVNQSCMDVRSLRLGASKCKDCNGNGVCNSRGHCHCEIGFAPPNCDYPGTGGSEDSGPASDPNARRDVMTALYVIFLGIVPFMALVALFMYYTRRNVKHWWKKSGRTVSSNTTAADSRGPPSTKPGEKKAPQRRISRGNSLAFTTDRNNLSGAHTLEISSPLPTDMRSSDSAHASLLPRDDGSNDSSPAALQNNFFGQFKGFSITPLPSTTSSPAKVQTSVSRTTAGPVSPPVVPPVTVKSSKPPTVAPKSNIVGGVSGRNNIAVTSAVSSVNTPTTSTPSALPTGTLTSSARPLISSPVLDATTCTAKELASAVPSRPAPQVPPAATNKPPRPISTPNTLNVNTVITDDKKIKDNGSSYPTLTRLASFMMRQNSASVARTQSQNQGPISDKSSKVKNKPVVEGTNSLPRTQHHGVKANKLQIDREALRNLEISNPIPQQEIDVPESSVPVRPAPPVPEGSKQVVMRAQSLRGNGPVTQRPSIPNFGSMRQASGTKRPTSIPPCTRPTSPPPRPPPPPSSKPSDLGTGIIGMPGYQNPPAVNQQDYCYDDCLNLLSEGVPPLAHIDEESSPNSGDNIYAIIEESPPEKGRRKLGGGGGVSEYAAPVSTQSAPETPPGKQKPGTNFEYSSPTFNEYKSPKPIENSVSAGSVESVGLLSEIVNEIQARNMESIYSTSTLRRKKKQENGGGSSDDDGESTVTATDSSVAGSSSPPLFRDKNSAVASSNSSLGTYVNAPYMTYRPGGSVYSNLSTQNNGSSSTSSKPSSSSASSNSGYLSPMTMNSAAKSAAAVSNSQDPPSKTKGQEFSTFKSPVPTSSTNAGVSSTISSAKGNDVSSSSNSSNAPPYKPYSSSLQRPFGPLASSFRTTSAPSSVNKSVKTAGDNSQTTLNSSTGKPAPKPPENSVSVSGSSVQPSVTSPTTTNSLSQKSIPGSAVVNKPTLTRTPTPPGLSSKSSGVTASKPNAAATVKTPPAGLRANNNFKTRTEANSMKTPDVVSSCAVSANSSASKSPDLVGGKIDSKPATKSEVVSGAAGKTKPNLTSLKNNTGVNRSQSSTASSAANKGASTPAGKISGINSSFKGGVAGKQPQPAPKPNVSKSSVETTSISSADTQDKKVIGNNKGVGSAVGRATALSKSASDATGNRTMPAAARIAASKLSHVASLQQKFETAASNNDKTNINSATPKTPVSSKSRSISSSVGQKSAVDTGRNVGFKK
ncbi:uncharacterized protein [Anabrus simplex]|uniref:uncharacterized protein n=1 Tax=Anabrus simplex TaxID=316456 RepID=UPI0035A28123